MKNIHILPTEKPSKLFYNVGGALLFKNYENHNGVNIYITSDEEIKEDYVIAYGFVIKVMMFEEETLYFVNGTKAKREDCKKIILTTDQDLIKDGVQAIDDEFLEWFVKNPSCEFVEVKPLLSNNGRALFGYKIIIPKEEPKQHVEFINNNIDQLDKAIESFKQETLEEVRKVERTELFNSIFSVVKQIPRKDVDGDAMDVPSCAYEIEQLFYKWQQERICDSVFLQKLRATISDAEARRLILETFKNK